MAGGLVTGLTVLVLLGCGTARRGEPVGRPVAIRSSELQSGQKVFLQHCHMCHPGGEGGLGPALNNKPLPAFALRMQVRRGLGVMPKFTDKEIADDELDDLIVYMKALRRSGK
jgi:mono/diheme cytochrome c family protein